jgi:hypothetical protein
MGSYETLVFALQNALKKIRRVPESQPAAMENVVLSADR